MQSKACRAAGRFISLMWLSKMWIEHISLSLLKKKQQSKNGVLGIHWNSSVRFSSRIITVNWAVAVIHRLGKPSMWFCGGKCGCCCSIPLFTLTSWLATGLERTNAFQTALHSSALACSGSSWRLQCAVHWWGITREQMQHEYSQAHYTD